MSLNTPMRNNQVAETTMNRAFCVCCGLINSFLTTLTNRKHVCSLPASFLKKFLLCIRCLPRKTSFVRLSPQAQQLHRFPLPRTLLVTRTRLGAMLLCAVARAAAGVGTLLSERLQNTGPLARAISYNANRLTHSERCIGTGLHQTSSRTRSSKSVRNKWCNSLTTR